MSHIENIHKMVECLTDCAKAEMEKGLENIDTKEFGEVTDAIKDLNEALYYAELVKAMKESEYGEDYDYEGRRYYDRYRYADGRFAPKGKGSYMPRRGFDKPPYYHMTPDMYIGNQNDPEYFRDMDREKSGKMYYTETGQFSSRNDSSTAGMQRDGREGRSGMSRKNYMESKEIHKGNSAEEKQAKMKELESYAKELTEDVTDMIADATADEKSLLKQKLSMLIQKI